MGVCFIFSSELKIFEGSRVMRIFLLSFFFCNSACICTSKSPSTCSLSLCYLFEKDLWSQVYSHQECLYYRSAEDNTLTVVRISANKEKYGKSLIPIIPLPEFFKVQLKFTKGLLQQRRIAKQERITSNLRLNTTIFIEQSKRSK